MNKTTDLYPTDLYTQAWVRRTYGPVLRARMIPIRRDFIHPEEHRCRSLIGSHRDNIHFMLDHMKYNIDAHDSERIMWYIHRNAQAVCALIAHIRIIRQQVALGIPVTVRYEVR